MYQIIQLHDNYINKAEEEGVKVFIAMAGLAAHLAGSIAAKTIKPVRNGTACRRRF